MLHVASSTRAVTVTRTWVCVGQRGDCEPLLPMLPAKPVENCEKNNGDMSGDVRSSDPRTWTNFGELLTPENCTTGHKHHYVVDMMTGRQRRG